MTGTKYIQTDATTANLAEMLLEKLASMELKLIGLQATVCTLSNPPNEAYLYTEIEAADMMKISLSTIKIIRSEGKINPLFVGGTIRYKMSDIMVYLDSCRINHS